MVEREREVELLDQRLADARDGAGNLVIIEGAAGTGKSRLLTAVDRMARQATMQVLRAQGAELERDLPFGVGIQLFEPPCSSAVADERTHLLRGPARRVVELMTGSLWDAERARIAGDQGYGVIHGLFWLTCNLAWSRQREGDALVLLVDDAHLVDRPSLRFLSYLAERLDDLPVLVVLTVGSGEGSSDERALMALRLAAGTALVRIDSLSDRGVAAIVESQFSDADDAFCMACAQATGGNPFLLVELVGKIRADGKPLDADARARLAEQAPESVLNAVLARLAHMPEHARAVASATAVLGQRASLSQVAGLAGLELDRASQAADALAATRLLRPGLPLSFEHPLIASAVLTSMAPLARGTAHRRAARILSDEGASAEQIASHLLAALPQSDPDSVEVLRTAARNALLNGAPDTAVRMLERALAEEPAPETYADVLAELGQAELSAGLPRAAERLEDARRRTALTPRRAELALVQAKALYDQERYRDAAEVADNALAELGPKDAAPVRELEAAYIAAASLVPDLLEHSRRRGAEMLAGIKRRPSADERDTIAHMAIRGGLYGEDRVYVRRLVDLGWSDGALLESDTSDKASWPLLSGASLFVDELERDLELCDAGLARARKHGSPVAYATASYCRTWALYERGFIVDALADARAALDASPNAWRSYVRPAYGAIASCHVVRGELEQAEAALSSVEHQLDKGGIQPPFLLNVRAKLRLAQNQPAAALGDAVESGRRLEDSFGFVSPGVIPWRSTAALAYIALAEPERACELAGEELDQARRIGVHRLVVRNLRILGLATRRIDLLTEAVREGGARPPRLEYTLALVDLGAALRRSNHRAAAREPLRKGLELSHRGGATAVADHARTELAATGARPRREMLSGVESLTPSERRIADLATKGFTTRQMAKSLFVTPKTVEFHLRNTYQKLGVRSRTQLVSVLDGDGSPAVTENL